MMEDIERDRIPLVVAFTPDYFVPAVTCLFSILEHASSDADFHVICLLSEVLPDDMRKALDVFNEQRLQVTYLNLQGKLGDIYIDERYTEAASYRLLLPDLLPWYDKVIYIDCDVVVRNDLAKLYRETSLSDCYLAAVFEASLDSQLDYLKALGISLGNYFNSGFLVMNLQKLREDGMVDRLLQAAKVPTLQFPDQDVLNQLCQGKVLALPPYYNSIRTFYLPQYKEAFLTYYSEENWSAVQAHGTVHYTGGKPWNTFTVEFGVWWYYYDQLPATIRSMWRPNRWVYLLSRVYATPVGKFCLNRGQHLLRRYKYGIS